MAGGPDPAGAEHAPSRGHARRVGAAGRRRGARRARVQRAFRPPGLARRARAVRARGLRRRRLAPPPRLRDVARARGRAGARPRLGGAAPLGARPLLHGLGARAGAARPRSSRRSTSIGTRASRTRSPRSATRTSTPPGCGRSRSRTARRRGPSRRRRGSWTPTRSTASPARRRSSSPGSRSAIPTCGSACGRRSTRGSSCPSAEAGSSPTATCPRASRSCGSSSTASAGTRAASAAAAASSGAPTRSATRASCRRSCARPGSRASSRRSCPGTASTGRSTTPSSGRATTAARCSATSLRRTRTTPRRRCPSCGAQVRDYRDHEHSGSSLLVFGYGDGGAGPTRTMLETLRRARDLQGLPRVALRTSEEFFDALEAEPGERPVVVGELYLEYHRGTYTSQGRTKRGNRRCEQALHDAEFLLCARGGDYPRAELDRLWKLLLLNQFHDILPGSSIRLVYEDAERDLAEVERAANALCGEGDVPVNTTGFPRREVAGDPLVVIEAPPYGSGRGVDAQDEVCVDGLTLENGQLRVEVAADGTVTSVVDKASGGRRSRRRATGSSSTTTDPSSSTPGTSTRSTSQTTARLRLGRFVLGDEHSTTGGSAVRAGAREIEPHDADRAARRPLAPARVSRGRRLARGADAAQGVLPTRCPRSARDVRDAVRLRGAADALLNELGPRALRGAWPPLRGPLGARLRRRAADRLEVRLQLPRARAAHQLAALAQEPGSRGRHGKTRVRVRPRPARGGLARRRHRRGGGRASTRRCAGSPTGSRGRSPRSTTRTSCWTRSSARRTRTRSCCGCTRRTAAGGRAGSDSRHRSRPRPVPTRSRTRAQRCRSWTARSSSRTGRTNS